MTPPVVWAWPSMYLVVEWTTMSAPCSKGRQRAGVGKVLSMTSGTPWAWATVESLAKSATSRDGFVTDSAKRARVLGRKAAAISSAEAEGGTKVVSMPMRFMVTAKRLKVPP